jgi:signal transduction histidine kinase
MDAIDADFIVSQFFKRLFDRFYKSDKSRSQDKSGVGLGLYIVQTLVKLHKGDLIVSSVEGEYVEFAFSLDAADPKAIKEHKKHRSAETS